MCACAEYLNLACARLLFVYVCVCALDKIFQGCKLSLYVIGKCKHDKMSIFDIYPSLCTPLKRGRNHHQIIPCICLHSKRSCWSTWVPEFSIKFFLPNFPWHFAVYLGVWEVNEFGGHIGREGVEAGERHARRLFELQPAHLYDGIEWGGSGAIHDWRFGRVGFWVTGVDGQKILIAILDWKQNIWYGIIEAFSLIFTGVTTNFTDDICIKNIILGSNAWKI